MTAHRNDWLSLKGYLNLQFSIFVSYLDFDAVFNVHCIGRTMRVSSQW